jgi:serine/threonine-protein kinase
MSETVALSFGLPSTIREGEVLGGKYRLEREIGRGAMGTVWSAVHLTLGQRVAIKLIAAEHAQAPEARARFSTEAKAAARLRSRYVVQVYDDGETAAGTPYIVLEYLDGETLEQRLVREHNVPLNDAVRITRHVARALSRAHAQGIVHRDLKPANIFLARTEDDELGWVAKVLDFGIAKFVEQGIASTTKTGTLLGTPLFMSPEQVRGLSSVDARSDLYSLGIVFFNMITGGYAFTGESFADVLVHICTKQLPDIRELAPWIPGSVADWFQRASARDPNHRFQTADELIESLDLALGVSTGALSRQSADEVKLDTLRGHAPPVVHELPPAAPSLSGDSANGRTHVLVSDPNALKSAGLPPSTEHVSTGTVVAPPPAFSLAPASRLTIPTSSRAPLFILGGVLALLMIGGAVLALGRKPTSSDVAASPSATVSAVAAPPSAASAPLSDALRAAPAPPSVVVEPAPAPQIPPESAAPAPASRVVPPHSAVSAPPAPHTAPPIKPAQTEPPPSPRPPRAPSRAPTPDMGF